MPSGSRLGSVGERVAGRAAVVACASSMLLAAVAIAGCLPADGWQRHRLTGTLVDTSRQPLHDYRVAVVPDGRQSPGTPDETLSHLDGRMSTTSDAAGRFTTETSTSTGCLANIPALLLVGPPVFVARAFTRGPGEPLWRRGPPETWGERAVCTLMCTGVGCNVPRVYGATLLTRGGNAPANAVRLDAALYYTGVVEEHGTTPDGVPFSEKVVTYDVGRVVLVPPAGATP